MKSIVLALRHSFVAASECRPVRSTCKNKEAMPDRMGQMPAKRSLNGSTVIVSICAVLVASIPVVASAQTTSRELLALSPKAADKMVRRDLLSILKPPNRISRGNQVGVNSVSMYTKPYGAGFEGLCRMDELFVHYAATSLEPKGLDQPIQAIGLDSIRLFHVTRGPLSAHVPSSSIESIWGEDCDNLQSGPTVGWFAAKSETDAAMAVNMLLAAAAGLKSNLFKLDVCDVGVAAGESCAQVVEQKLKLGDIDSVDNCDSFSNHDCYIIYLAGDTPWISLTIKADVDDQILEVSKITSISAEQYVVVS